MFVELGLVVMLIYFGFYKVDGNLYKNLFELVYEDFKI